MQEARQAHDPPNTVYPVSRYLNPTNDGRRTWQASVKDTPIAGEPWSERLTLPSVTVVVSHVVMPLTIRSGRGGGGDVMKKKKKKKPGTSIPKAPASMARRSRNSPMAVVDDIYPPPHSLGPWRGGFGLTRKAATQTAAAASEMGLLTLA
jgi:hypothetical protein